MQQAHRHGRADGSSWALSAKDKEEDLEGEIDAKQCSRMVGSGEIQSLCSDTVSAVDHRVRRHCGAIASAFPEGSATL
jgi:hypothetical protein